MGLSFIIKQRNAKWSPPPQFKFKQNYDGAAKGNPSNSRIGVVIFDHNSKIIKTSCKFIGIGTKNSIEFHSLSYGLDLSISLNIRDIVIEGDSIVTFDVVSNSNVPLGSYNTSWIKSLDNCSFSIHFLFLISIGKLIAFLISLIIRQ